MGASLEKLTQFAFGVQSAQGTAKTSALTWIPMRGTTDLEVVPNQELLDAADGYDHDHLMYSAGYHVEGNAVVSLQPIDATLESLIDWILTRDSYNQGQFATVVIKDTQVQRQFMDVKVSRATFRFTAGQPVEFELALVGIQRYTATTIAQATTDATAPYLFNEATVSVDWDVSGSAVADTSIKSIQIDIDNRVQDPREGFRLRAQAYPTTLYNEGAPAITGRMTRDHIGGGSESQDPYSSWLTQFGTNFTDAYKARLTIAVARTETLTLTMDNLQFTRVAAHPRGSRRGTMDQEIEFTCLADTDDACPIAITAA